MAFAEIDLAFSLLMESFLGRAEVEVDGILPAIWLIRESKSLSSDIVRVGFQSIGLPFFYAESV